MFSSPPLTLRSGGVQPLRHGSVRFTIVAIPYNIAGGILDSTMIHGRICGIVDGISGIDVQHLEVAISVWIGDVVVHTFLSSLLSSLFVLLMVVLHALNSRKVRLQIDGVMLSRSV